MKSLRIAAAAIAGASTTFAETDTFDKAPVGSPPADWTCGVTGGMSSMSRVCSRIGLPTYAPKHVPKRSPRV